MLDEVLILRQLQSSNMAKALLHKKWGRAVHLVYTRFFHLA